MRTPPESSETILSMSRRWPRRGDRLLRHSDDWNRGVEFSGDRIARHAHIWSGYMSAGSVLVDACEEQGHERHFLIYPILFNYRHGIELAMKWIITMYGAGGIGEIEHHDLWRLWKVCRPIIEASGADEGTEFVEKVIKEFHDLDRSALAFRYWRNKQGGLIKLPDGMIDLQNVQDVMNGVAHYFEGADTMLGELSGASDW